MPSRRSDEIRRAALAYLARGWSVVPVHAKKKHPLIPWEEFQGRPPTEEEVNEWFDRFPDANVGIVTGVVSGLVVLDVDPRHGGDASLVELLRAHGPLPATIEAITGGGGRHLYFAMPRDFMRNLVAVLPGIDVRAEGGLVVAPPSIHASGKRYRWQSARDLSTTLAPLPDWLVTLSRASETRRGHPLAHWRTLVREGIAEGARNSTIASFAGHLLWHGVDPEIVLELLLCWNRERCRPPLSDEEVARTVENITRLHLGREQT